MSPRGSRPKFELIEISNEEIVGYRFAEPFGRLHGEEPASDDEDETFERRWAETWGSEPREAGIQGLEPNAEAVEAATSSPIFGAGGSNVESLVRFKLRN